MNTHTLRRDIGAYGALLDYASKKRYGVKHLDFPQDKSGAIARDLNTKIAEKSGIDIFQSVSEEEVERYENVVSAELIKFIEVHIPPPYQSDEDEFLKNVVRLSPDYFDNLFIKVSEPFKQDIGISLSESMLNDITRTPDYIDCVHIDSPFDVEDSWTKCYLVTKYFNTAQPEIVFAFVSQDDKMKYGTLYYALVLRSAKFLDNRENPSKIFFQILDTIGVDIELDGETKRFFSGTILPERGRYYYDQKLYEVEYKKRVKNGIGIIKFTRENASDVINFGYYLDMDRYKALRRKHQI